ncbi:MAG TPA: M23 family metallopeptidase [Steroidobacteraceae bacterium]
MKHPVPLRGRPDALAYVAVAYVAAALLPLVPQLALASPLIRFCPAAQVRTYPLESLREIQGLLLQNVAIINPDRSALRVDAITVALLHAGAVQEQRFLSTQEIAGIARRSQQLGESGAMALISFQFCGQELLEPGERPAGQTLAQHEALLVMQQVFALNAPADTLRVHVTGDVDGKPVEVSGDLPIRSDLSKITYRFPLRGVWYAGVGPTFHTGHRWVLPEEFAFDIARLGKGGLTHAGNGTRFSDYYAYGSPVYAAAAGRVIVAHDGEQEDPKAMRQPAETQEMYVKRLQAEQETRLKTGLGGIAGNYLMLDHGNGEYSLYAHLKPSSVLVRVGQSVRESEPLGRLGSSGNSTEPHLHFQLCDRPAPLQCAGIPIAFKQIEIPWADLPRPLQSGDVLIAR